MTKLKVSAETMAVAYTEQKQRADKLTARVRVLEEALRFYADEENYRVFRFRYGTIERAAAEIDGGRKARAALAAGEGTT